MVSTQGSSGEKLVWTTVYLLLELPQMQPSLPKGSDSSLKSEDCIFELRAFIQHETGFTGSKPAGVLQCRKSPVPPSSRWAFN